MVRKIKNVPDIRFKEFNTIWEKRKFKDFVSKAGIKNKNNKDYVSYSINNKKGLTIQSDQFESSRLDELEKTSYKLVNPGDFAYNPARINVGSIAYSYLEKTVIVSSLYVVVKMSDKVHNPYIYQFIRSKGFNNEVRRNTEGSVRQYLFFDNFKNIKFPYTENIKEQIKIGDFFIKLDNNISFNQQALDLLKQRKKAFLQKMFPNNGETCPVIRFPEFKDEWRQMKIKDVGSVVMCKRIYKEQTNEEGGIPFYKIGTFGGEPNSFISSELFNEFKKKYTFPEIGDVLISASGTIGRTVVYDGEDAYFQDSNIIWIKRDKSLISNTFLKTFYQVVKWSGLEGSTIKRLYNSNILSTAINLPSIEEQEKIGNFFKLLDVSITLQDQKLESMKEMKKAFLQKMFV